MQFTNGNDSFRRHFSADEFGILEASIAFTLIYFLLVIVGLIWAKILFNKMLLHITFKIFLVSVAMEFVSFLFLMSEYSQFSLSGISTPGMITISNLIMFSGELRNFFRSNKKKLKKGILKNFRCYCYSIHFKIINFIDLKNGIVFINLTQTK